MPLRGAEDGHLQSGHGRKLSPEADRVKDSASGVPFLFRVGDSLWPEGHAQRGLQGFAQSFNSGTAYLEVI